uniref:MAGE domain-containing protein n=1 Tax=Strigamia maritima TaxID=126957 RepID=T1J0E5_STRMM
SDDEYGPSQTQTQGKSSQLSGAEINSLADSLVHYIFVCDQKKNPIKQIDMRKQVLKENGAAIKNVLEVAKEKLTQIFGVVLQPIVGRAGQFMLINKIQDDLETPIITWSEDEQVKSCLLFIILSAIFMNENVMSDEQLWTMLKKFGIEPDVAHEEFGDVKKLINNEYKQQLYLDVVKNATNEPPSYEYRWGPRAISEISKTNVLDFVCTVNILNLLFN